MSDEKDPDPQAIERFFSADLEQFFADRHTNPSCEVCMTNNWAVTEADQTGKQLPAVSSVSETGENFIFGGVVYPIIILSCTNCGNMRMINRSVVSKWRRARHGK